MQLAHEWIMNEWMNEWTILFLYDQKMAESRVVFDRVDFVAVTAAFFATENAPKCTVSRVKILPYAEVAP